MPVNPAGPNRWWTTREVERAAQLHRQGHTTPQIARALGRSQQSTYHHLKRRGLIPDKPDATAVVREHLALIEEWRQQGSTLRTCAGRLGIGETSLWRALTVLGRADLATGKGRGIANRGKRRSRDSRDRIAMGAIDRHRKAAALLGWPEADSAVEARLMALLASEALTANEIADRMGWARSARNHQPPTCWRYLRRLRRKGYLEATPTRPARYRLANWLFRRREDD